MVCAPPPWGQKTKLTVWTTWRLEWSTAGTSSRSSLNPSQEHQEKRCLEGWNLAVQTCSNRAEMKPAGLRWRITTTGPVSPVSRVSAHIDITSPSFSGVSWYSLVCYSSLLLTAKNLPGTISNCHTTGSIPVRPEGSKAKWICVWRRWCWRLEGLLFASVHWLQAVKAGLITYNTA